MSCPFSVSSSARHCQSLTCWYLRCVLLPVFVGASEAGVGHTARHPVMHMLSQSAHREARRRPSTASMLFVDLC